MQDLIRYEVADSVATITINRGKKRNAITYAMLSTMLSHTKALATCFASDDHREGVALFLERRPAVFPGR